MQAQRPVDIGRSSSPLGRPCGSKSEQGSEEHLILLRDARDRVLPNQRSVSPKKFDTSSWNMRRGSHQRREVDWRCRDPRTEQVYSRSPISGRAKKRLCYDEGFRRRVNEFLEPSEDFDADYHSGARRWVEEEDCRRSRVTSSTSEYKMLDNEKAIRDGALREPYCEICAMEQSSLRPNGIHQFQSESYRCSGRAQSNKLSSLESHKEAERGFYSRDVVRHADPVTTYPKEFSKCFRHDDFQKSINCHSRRDMVNSYDREPMQPSDKMSNKDKFAKTLYADAHSQRKITDSRRYSEVGEKTIQTYKQNSQDTFRVEHYDYDMKPQIPARNDYEYKYDKLHRMMPLHHEVIGRVNYSRGETNDCLKNVSSPSITHDVVDRDEITKEYRNLDRRSAWSHTSIHDSTATDCFGTSDTSQQGHKCSDYGCTHDTHGRRLLQVPGFGHMGGKQVNQVSNWRPHYDIRRDDDLEILRESHSLTPISKYDEGMHRAATRVKRVEATAGCSYELSAMTPNRMYNREKEFRGHAHRSIVLTKRNRTDFEDFDNGEELIDEDMADLFSNSAVTYDSDEESPSEIPYDRQRYRQDHIPSVWLPSQNAMEHEQEYPVKLSKHGNGCWKGYPKSHPFSLKQYKSHFFNHPKRYHKNQKSGKRYDDSCQSKLKDDTLLEEPDSTAAFEYPEESEEFEKLVHDAFLKYSKRLNANSHVQRLYLAEGKAGSLFCIVCGRSLGGSKAVERRRYCSACDVVRWVVRGSSKEFQGTQNLAKHALMARKFELRAQHLGLHKAICVLLGWSLMPTDPKTWAPAVLPPHDSLAQKEDLILWPPLVVIHNVSMVMDDPKEQKLIPRERIEALLRGKGFVEGKIVVCLGKPADQSVLVVKFLNTFSGLGNASKLHGYFAENKRGRLDFQKKTSNQGKGNGSEASKAQMEDREELLLYGYIGIAEDMDKLDFHTKKTSLIKSKKEIYDLANAPVKSDENQL